MANLIIHNLPERSRSFLGIGITFLLFELSFVPAQICEYHQDTKQQVCTISDTTSEIVWHILKFLGDNSPALTAFATIIIACFTYTLWEATHGLRKLAVKQAEDMRESLRTATYRLKYSGLYPPLGSGTFTFCEDGNNAD